MNIGTCPHCKNAYSRTAETCPVCEQAMLSDTLSEFDIVEPITQSKTVTYLVHILAAFSGIAGLFIAGNLQTLLRVILMPFNIFMGFYGIQLILGLFFFATFLLLGALFGFVWDKGGWKLGFSLGSLVTAVWILAFLLDVFSGYFSFSAVVSVITNTFPVLAGSCLGAYFGANYKQKQHTKDGVV